MASSDEAVGRGGCVDDDVRDVSVEVSRKRACEDIQKGDIVLWDPEQTESTHSWKNIFWVVDSNEYLKDGQKYVWAWHVFDRLRNGQPNVERKPHKTNLAVCDLRKVKGVEDVLAFVRNLE